MIGGHVSKARVADGLRRPVQQRDVHHRVDDDPTGAVAVPRANELSARIVAAREQVGRVKAPLARALVARQAIIRDGREQPHEADVVVQAGVAVERAVELLLDPAGRPQVRLVARQMPHLPANARPKTVRPPDKVLRRRRHVPDIAPVLGDIGDLVAFAGDLRRELGLTLLERLHRPIGIIAGKGKRKILLNSHHTPPIRRNGILAGSVA